MLDLFLLILERKKTLQFLFAKSSSYWSSRELLFSILTPAEIFLPCFLKGKNDRQQSSFSQAMMQPPLSHKGPLCYSVISLFHVWHWGSNLGSAELHPQPFLFLYVYSETGDRILLIVNLIVLRDAQEVSKTHFWVCLSGLRAWPEISWLLHLRALVFLSASRTPWVEQLPFPVPLCHAVSASLSQATMD